MAGEDPLQDLAAVAGEVEAVGDRCRPRRTLARAARIIAAAIAADERRLAVRLEPRREGVRRAIRQHVDDAVALQVRQDGAVVVAPAEGKVVDTQHPRGRDRRLGQRPHAP